LLPIESKFETLKHENRIFDQSSQQNKKYLNQLKLNMESGSGVTKPKLKDWLSKEIMLPILGKNKTTLFHSIDQFEEGISY
jgi:hypothetical protein